MTNPLISADELAGLLQDGVPVTLLDVRWQLGARNHYEEYLAGHLPGAVFCDLEFDLSAAKAADGTGGRHPMPGPEAFEASMRALGVRDGTPVVLYDAAKSLGPARGWWMLRYFGKEDVRVLDGGVGAWTAAGHALVQGEQRPAGDGDFTARPAARRLLVADDVLPFAEAGGVVVDGRPADRFRGENDTVDARPGHIPGARCVPALENLRPDGRLLPAEQLRERFAAAGVSRSADAVLYCGSGVQASHLALAMESAGIGGTEPAVYIGSWSDWVSRPDRPAETGPAR